MKKYNPLVRLIAFILIMIVFIVIVWNGRTREEEQKREQIAAYEQETAGYIQEIESLEEELAKTKEQLQISKFASDQQAMREEGMYYQEMYAE